MDRGVKSFLTATDVDKALPVVLKIFREEFWVKVRVAKRLGVNYTTLWRWLSRNPKAAEKIQKAQEKAQKEEVE